jgi:hypothetical protein
MTGAAVGLLLGALAALGAWKMRQGALRPWMAAAGLAGIAAGAIVASRRRWSDPEVALYLDGRLGANEAITTAVELRNRAEQDEEARAVVVRQAAEALDRGDPKRVRPAVLAWDHLLIPLSVAMLVAVARMPLPRPAVVPAAPGADKVQLARVEGLEKIAALGAIGSPDEAQRKRLEKLAEQARKLREKLNEGMERREAQSEIARLRDDIVAERMSLGDGERRAGLEAAHGQLAKEALTKDAAKALGDRDLTRFDEEMQKLANQREQGDREKAKKALEDAAEAARKAGAPDVARALEEQRKLFEERSKRSQALKDLGEAFGKDLPPDVKQDLEDLAREGLDKDSAKLAEKMAGALEKLTPEERKKLGEKLRQNAEKGNVAPMDKERMRELAKKLGTPEGQKELLEQLRKMANEPPKSEEAQRGKALGEAEKGAGEAEQQLGGGAAPLPIPMAGNDPGQPGGGKCKGGGDAKGGAGKSGGGDAKDGKGGPGSHHDTGRGSHAGASTPEIDAKGLHARAGGKINPGAPMPGVVAGRSAGRPGETANIRGQGALGEVAPGEVSGVERSDVPEEYREQVGKYFSP